MDYNQEKRPMWNCKAIMNRGDANLKIWVELRFNLNLTAVEAPYTDLAYQDTSTI